MKNSKNTQTKKPLKLKDTESVANLFADDLIRYFRLGGDMNNLTAKKVYAKLRDSDETVYDHSILLANIEKTEEEIKEVLKDYPYLDDGQESRELVDLMFDIDLTEDDQNFLLDKLDLDDDSSNWTAEQHAAYIKEALKLRGIREEDSYRYIKAVYHNTNEEVDFEKLFANEISDSDKE